MYRSIKMIRPAAETQNENTILLISLHLIYYRAAGHRSYKIDCPKLIRMIETTFVSLYQQIDQCY